MSRFESPNQPDWEMDGWNLGVILTLGGALASLLGAVGAERPSSKAALSTLGTALGAAGTVVGLVMPPRCPICLTRAVQRSEAGHFCPSCRRAV